MLGMMDQARQSVTEVHHLQGPPWCQTRTSRSGSGSLLQVPLERYGTAGAGRRSSSGIRVGEILFEEETDMIRNCGAFSSAVLGLMKSFSTSDICSLNDTPNQLGSLRQSSSELALFGTLARLELPNIKRLDYTSRSCSTWVNLGEPVSSASQLPSPQAQPGLSVESPSITAIDFVQSVNKKVRQMYIRRRLLSTYRALGRLTTSRSQMNINDVSKGVNSVSDAAGIDTTCKNSTVLPLQDSQSLKAIYASFDFANLCFKSVDGSLSLTVKDIERNKGKPLTKYERNIMIFNWLQNVNEGEANVLEQMGST